jgi:serine/threonine protein kinase/predicted Zn-dependent protease
MEKTDQFSGIDKFLPSCERFIKNKLLKAFIVYGKKGIDKKKFTGHLLDKIFSDQSLLIYASKLNKRDVFRTSYSSSDRNQAVPYKAFIEITKLIEKRRKLMSIISRVFGILIAFTGYGDLVDKFKELADEINESGENEEKLNIKEKKLFKQFAKEIKRYSKKKPLIIVIENAQWMDQNSLQLLKYLLEESKTFWGLIILDYTIEEYESPEFNNILWNLIKNNRIKTFKARPLDRQYLENYQNKKFGKIIFSEDESERIIEICQGIPSKLDELIKEWISKNLIFQENGIWEKSERLNLKELKTEEERLIEICKVFMKDGTLSGSEEESFFTQAKSQGFTDEQIEELKTLAFFEIKNPKYHIIKKVRAGTIGDIFKALDKEKNQYVFIEIDRGLKDITIGDDKNSLRSTSFLNTLEISNAENFNFTVTDYSRGKTLADLKHEYKFFSFDKSYKITKNLLSAISLLHRKNFIHGNISPDNIYLENESSIRVGGVGFVKNLRDDVSKGITSMKKSPYSSPEHIKGERLSLQSDVFSLGVIIYELFTGKLPFKGQNEKQINEEILHGSINESIYLDQHPDIKSILYKALDKSDQVRQSSAESLNIAFDHVKAPPLAPEEIAKPKEEEKEKTPFRGKLKWVFAPLLLAAILYGGYKGWQKFFAPSYSDIIAIQEFSYNSSNIEKGLIEYLLQRSLKANSNSFIYDINGSNNHGMRSEKPKLIVSGDIKHSFSGFTISIDLELEGKNRSRDFWCKGYFDLLSDKINQIHAFISSNSADLINEFNEGQKFSDLFTESWDACNHFMKGNEAWEKIEIEEALAEYTAATEYDPEFSLARLKLIEVMAWQGYVDEAKREIERAFENQDNLIESDILRLKSLQAKIYSNPLDERRYLRQLVESFPGRKTYHYEFAESYFHYGDAEEAIGHYLNALNLDNNYTLAHNHLGFCYSWIGKHDLAIEHLNKYVELDKTANSYDSLASGYMFAGKEDLAIDTCKNGLKIKNLYYLYGNMGANLLLDGRLREAEQNLEREAKLAGRKSLSMDSYFELAYIDYLRGKVTKAEEELEKVLEFYSTPTYENELDDSSNFAYWFKGLLAFHRNDRETLAKNLIILKKKIENFKVSEQNYFPIFKFYIHLKALDGYLNNNEGEVLDNINTAKRIKQKLGYWSSIFNLPYFFCTYADLLIKMDYKSDAQELLTATKEYNPNYAYYYILQAKLHTLNNEQKEAQRMIEKAKTLLSDADEDYILIGEMKRIEDSLS